MSDITNSFLVLWLKHSAFAGHMVGRTGFVERNGGWLKVTIVRGRVEETSEG